MCDIKTTLGWGEGFTSLWWGRGNLWGINGTLYEENCGTIMKYGIHLCTNCWDNTFPENIKKNLSINVSADRE